jgi:L-ascorbate metabolism protein UlaG (beta-lactamase superfamily)
LRVVLGLAFASASCGPFLHTQPAKTLARPAVEDTGPLASARLKAYWLGHATVLVEMGDRWILTDPNFSSRTGLLVKRRVAPGIDLDALPEIDWVLVSHAHFDHLDVPSLRRVGEQAAVAVPPDAARYLPDVRFREVAQLMPWQAVEREGVRITAVPVQHGDGRFALDGLYHHHAHTGYIVEYRGMTVFFAGDTAYHPSYFKQIGQRFRIDLALLPMGPAGSRAFGRLTHHAHARPDEAMRIFAELGARWMIPIHHGTFFTGGEPERREIAQAIARHPLAARVALLESGQSLTIE